METEDILLPVPEVCRQLGGISKWTVYSWLAQGKLRRSKVGSRVMVRRSQLARVIKEGGESGRSRRRLG
jgi:excisionase family DNA binding protein